MVYRILVLIVCKNQIIKQHLFTQLHLRYIQTENVSASFKDELCSANMLSDVFVKARMTDWMIYWLINWLTDWLIDWLIDCIILKSLFSSCRSYKDRKKPITTTKTWCPILSQINQPAPLKLCHILVTPLPHNNSTLVIHTVYNIGKHSKLLLEEHTTFLVQGKSIVIWL